MKLLQFIVLLCLPTHSVAGRAPFEVASLTGSRSRQNGVKFDPFLLKPSDLSFPSERTNSLSAALRCRGGACQDSNPALFFKVGFSAAMETGLMVGLIVGSKKLSEQFSLPKLFGLSASTWLSLFLVIFASSFFGSIVDGTMSAATNQVLSPNMTPGDPNWYTNLVKPSWNPPGWLFPIMWLIVSKPTQLLAVSRILKSDPTAGSKPIPLELLIAYCAHLSLGDAWNKVFFGLQCTGRGAAVITVFYGLLLATAYLFYSVDPTAGKLMLPTCGWVTIATALNWNIYLTNK